MAGANREVAGHHQAEVERMRRDRARWSSGDDSARKQGGRRSFCLTRRGRIPARSTNGVRTVDEQHHLGGQVGVFHARLDEELVHESLPSTQMRERGLTNGMAWAVDL